MISPAEFEELLSPVAKFVERSEIVNDALMTIFGQVPEYNDEANRLCDAYLDLVAKQLGLEKPDILDWFVYENEFGKGNKSYQGVSSLSDLYDYISKRVS